MRNSPASKDGRPKALVHAFLVRVFLCGNLPRINLISRADSIFSACADLGKHGDLAVPPPPTPSKSLEWRGFCKNGLQNLERVRVRGQNLESKKVTSPYEGCAHTPFAVAMICLSRFRVKVRCHNELRKRSGLQMERR